MTTDTDYSTGPFVAIRVFYEGPHWAIDAVDANGGYSEAIWTHWDNVELDRDTAIAHTADFAAEHAPGITNVCIVEHPEGTDR